MIHTGQLTHRSFSSEPVLVRGKAYTEQEQYSKSDVNLEITPISITQGERTYLHLKLFVLVPDIVLTIDLYPQASAWEDFARFLCEQFVGANKIVTTTFDPMFETEQYQAFLRSCHL